MQTGQTVTPQNIDRFAETEVKGAARVEKRFRGQDGIERLNVKTRISMVHGHAHHRASWYAPLALKYGQQREIPPARVLAVMHTEPAVERGAKPAPWGLATLTGIAHAGTQESKCVEDWETLVIRAVGRGVAPYDRFPVRAQARIMALEGARAMAYAPLCECIVGLRAWPAPSLSWVRIMGEHRA